MPVKLSPRPVGKLAEAEVGVCDYTALSPVNLQGTDLSQGNDPSSCSHSPQAFQVPFSHLKVSGIC